MDISCAPEQIYSLKNSLIMELDSNQVIVPSSSILNFFTFNLQNLTNPPSDGISNPGGFTYVFDFNGDGLYDSGWLSLPSNNITEYVIYRGIRDVKIKFKDNLCQSIQELTIKKDFGSKGCADPSWSSMADGLPFEDGIIFSNTPGFSRDCLTADHLQNEEYLFLQGEVASNLTPATQILISEKVQAGSTPKYVKCHFNVSNPDGANHDAYTKGNFEITGLHHYDRGMDGKFDHGLGLVFSNLDVQITLNDDGTIAVVQVDAENANFSQVTYQTDAEADKIGGNRKSYLHQGNNGCNWDLIFEPMNGPGVCGQSGASFGVKVYGSYNCGIGEFSSSNSAKLRRSDSQEYLSIDKGEFFCIVNSVPPCPVGGGGGGGGISPEGE